ncbi:hypothetical protein [Streptomyces sp. 184]|uniref:hypothetical protein n=1 Tax=Streptomyces sp. 184 TaxID=1827526 RepID=UPI00389216FD
MDEHDWLAERFETDRPRLRPLAYRLLGPSGEAGRQGWTRLSRADRVGADTLDGCLRTTVAQVTLHFLRSRTIAELPSCSEDSARVSMLVVLDTLAPPERLAYALQDMFAAPFEEVAAVAARAQATPCELAGSARGQGLAGGYEGGGKDGGEAGHGGGAYGESVYDASAPGAEAGTDTASTDVAGTDTADTNTTAPNTAGTDIAAAFLAASRRGDFEALLKVLDPHHPPRTAPPTADRDRPPGPKAPAATPSDRRGGDAVIGTTEVQGTESVTRVCTVRTLSPVPALVGGGAGLAWIQNGRPQLAFRFTVHDGEITATELATDLTDLSIVY